MFTGIVEGIALLQQVEDQGARISLRLDAGELSQGVSIGDSIALDGCCLTVIEIDGTRLTFHAIPETLARSSLAGKKPGSRLNVERALPAGGRLDGHIVQGHVDGVGVVRELARCGEDVRLSIDCERELAELLVPKGSIAVDGVSLTVVDPGPSSFSVALIPHTLEATTLGERAEGDRVNLEADVLGKYVRHYLEQRGL
jgi:riboflavin synthase